MEEVKAKQRYVAVSQRKEFKERGNCVPLYVEFLSEELPVLALGVGSVEGGADSLPDGRRDFEGFGARL